MSNIPENLRYAKSHEWVRVEDDGSVTVGISDHAQEMLGDLVFVELPDVGQTLSAGEQMAVVESVKAASDLFMPVAGDILAVNEDLIDAPETLNSDPYSAGWLIRIKMSEPDKVNQLMDAAAYEKYCAERS